MSSCAWPNNPLWRPPLRQGLTLMEVVVSTLIVGVMTVAALNGLGAATRSGQLAGNRGIAHGLADDLMNEILNTAYAEPSGAVGIGLDTGETAPRTNFDDVDDFHNWNQKPPQAADGTTIPNRAAFRQRVTVEKVVPTDPAQVVAGADQGAKRICVMIECNDVELARRVAVVTDFDD
jgi:prepilin-type N-terminal cleavage/methylation domain-containing protein